MPRIHS